MGSDFGELELCSQKPQSRSPVVNAQRGKRYAVLSNRRTRKSFETHVDSIIRYKSYNRTSLLEYADLSISHYTPLLGLLTGAVARPPSIPVSPQISLRENWSALLSALRAKISAPWQQLFEEKSVATTMEKEQKKI